MNSRAGAVLYSLIAGKGNQKKEIEARVERRGDAEAQDDGEVQVCAHTRRMRSEDPKRQQCEHHGTKKAGVFELRENDEDA